VPLLADQEILDLALQQEPAICGQLGLAFISYPVVDRGVPDSAGTFLSLVDRLSDLLNEGRRIVIHCRMGIGRSSLIAAILLVKSGYSVADAFDAISQARGVEVPDTGDQITWVKSIN